MQLVTATAYSIVKTIGLLHNSCTVSDKAYQMPQKKGCNEEESTNKVDVSIDSVSQ